LANPTDWSASTLPGFTDNTRGACRIVFTQGYAMGGFVVTVRLKPQAGRDSELIANLGRAMPQFTEMRRITGAHLVRNDPELTGGNAGNQRGRMIHLPDLVVVVEASNAEGARDAVENVLSEATLREWGADPEMVRGLYQLEYSI